MTRFAIPAEIRSLEQLEKAQMGQPKHRSDPKAHHEPDAFVAHSGEFVRQSASRGAFRQVNTECQQGHGNREDPVAQSGQALNIQARVRVTHRRVGKQLRERETETSSSSRTDYKPPLSSRNPLFFY
jgi:hypothetical protein